MSASPDNTPVKQDCYRAIVGTECGMMSRLVGRHYVHPVVTHVDLTAAGGYVTDREGNVHAGSPLIALDVADSLNLPLRAIFVERNPERVRDLRGVLSGRGYGTGRVIVVEGDHASDDTHQAIDGWSGRHRVNGRWHLGWIYVDLDGDTPGFPVAAINRLIAIFPRFEVILHGGANQNYHRMRAAGIHDRRLADDIRAIRKQHVAVREVMTAKQWLMAVLTDDERVIARHGHSRWQGRGFCVGDAAWELLDRHSLTRQERIDREHDQ